MAITTQNTRITRMHELLSPATVRKRHPVSDLAALTVQDGREVGLDAAELLGADGAVVHVVELQEPSLLERLELREAVPRGRGGEGVGAHRPGPVGHLRVVAMGA